MEWEPNDVPEWRAVLQRYLAERGVVPHPEILWTVGAKQVRHKSVANDVPGALPAMPGAMPGVMPGALPGTLPGALPGTAA